MQGLFKGVFLAGIFSAVLSVQSAAVAGTVVLSDDSGGGSVVSITGTSTGATVTGNSSDIVTSEINGSTGLSIPTSYSFTITDGAMVGGLRSVTVTGETVIGTTPGSEAILHFTASGFSAGSFIDLSGTITSVTEDAYPGYSFTSMADGNITLSINKTGTNYNNILGHAGASVSGSGFGFQQSAVPEPASWSLLGIGMAGFFAYRRYFKRPAVA